MSGNYELGHGLRGCEKNANEAGAGCLEKSAPDAQAALPEAHEWLISPATVAEVPLTGLSFDRLAIATAEGRFIGEEATLSLAVEAVLAKTPGPIVVNCSTSGMAAAIAATYGVPCQVSAVGEANVVDAMLASGAILGGEGNGGVIDPRVVLVRDSFVAMALVLERMCTAGGSDRVEGGITSIESLARGLPRMIMRKTKVELSAETRGPALARAFDRIERAFPRARVSRLDGLRLDWDGGWLLVRSSNTEPIVRIVAEAGDTGAVDEAVQRATSALLGG